MAGPPPSARHEIDRLRKGLDVLFERAFAVDAGSEIAGDVNRYLCVRVCGFAEQALLATGRAACERMSGGIGRSFSLSWLERSFNPSSDNVSKFVRRFSPTWAEEFVLYLSDEERSSRLNALVGIRNDIAHGKNQGVSPVQARDYYALVIDITEWIADRLDPKPGMQPASVP